MYSKVIKVNGKEFRYDYDRCVVEWVHKADEQMKQDNIEWQEKFGRNLFEIDEDGYEVVETVGLSKEHWDHAGTRKEYLTEWGYDLDEEAAYMAEMFVKYEL